MYWPEEFFQRRYLLAMLSSTKQCYRFVMTALIRARTSLAAGCLTQAISIVLFTLAIGHHSLVWACTGLSVAGYAYGAIFVGSATLVNMISPAARFHCFT